MASEGQAAETWDTIYRSGRAVRTWPSEDVVRFCARRLGKGQRVLEAGCGNGANVWFLTSQRYRTVGADCSATALAASDLAVRVRDSEGIAWLSLVNCELGLLQPDGGLVDCSFDAIIDCRASQHIAWSRHRDVYREYYQLLKPGGWLFLLHLDDETSDARLNDDLRSVRTVPPTDSTWAAVSAGVDVSAEPYTWTDIARGIYPRNGLTCMPPREALNRVLSASGFQVVRREDLRRTVQQDGLVTSHVAFDARRPSR